MKLLKHIIPVIVLAVVAACNKHEEISYQEKDRLYQMMDMLRADTSLSITVEALDKAQLSP
jgi:hypothetical protein